MSLDLMLLSRILTIALAIKLKLKVKSNNLVTLLVRRFYKLYLIEELEIVFKMVPEIW